MERRALITGRFSNCRRTAPAWICASTRPPSFPRRPQRAVHRIARSEHASGGEEDRLQGCSRGDGERLPTGLEDFATGWLKEASSRAVPQAWRPARTAMAISDECPKKPEEVQPLQYCSCRVPCGEAIERR